MNCLKRLKFLFLLLCLTTAAECSANFPAEQLVRNGASDGAGGAGRANSATGYNNYYNERDNRTRLNSFQDENEEMAGGEETGRKEETDPEDPSNLWQGMNLPYSPIRGM